MSLLEKLKKNSTIKETDILAESKFFNDVEFAPTSVPALNIALSGSISGGLSSGSFIIAGPSRHFKTAFALVCAKAYLDKNPDSVLMFYDSEFGSPQAYFDNFGIDRNQVLHTPISSVEQLRHDISVQLEQIERKDKVIIIIDSIGNLASKKETQDALEGKDSADMTRAKVIKSLYRIITPVLKIKDIPLISICHVYQTMELYSKAIISGGSGLIYSADHAWIVGRSQEKDGTDVIGYNFNIRVEKSRFVREQSKVPITVTFEGGLNKWSGLLEMALESGLVVKPSNGWYSLVNPESGEVDAKKVREKDTQSEDFLGVVLKSKAFENWVNKNYKLETPKTENLTTD